MYPVVETSERGAIIGSSFLQSFEAGFVSSLYCFCVEPEVGLDGPSGSLPTQNILWFSDKCLIFLGISGFTVVALQ